MWNPILVKAIGIWVLFPRYKNKSAATAQTRSSGVIVGAYLDSGKWLHNLQVGNSLQQDELDADVVGAIDLEGAGDVVVGLEQRSLRHGRSKRCRRKQFQLSAVSHLSIQNMSYILTALYCNSSTR